MSSQPPTPAPPAPPAPTDAARVAVVWSTAFMFAIVVLALLVRAYFDHDWARAGASIMGAYALAQSPKLATMLAKGSTS